MSDDYLVKLDNEDKRMMDEFSEEGFDLEKFLGFKLPKGRCFMPPNSCGRNVSSLMGLIPLYDVVFFPIYPDYVAVKNGERVKITNQKQFEEAHLLKESELQVLAENGRVIPYFSSENYTAYDRKIVDAFFKSGVPTISPAQISALSFHHIWSMKNGELWTKMNELANKDRIIFDFDEDCVICLTACYVMGLRDMLLKEEKEAGGVVCYFSDLLAVNPLRAVLQTNCRFDKPFLSRIGGLPENFPIEYILEGLKINYSLNIPLDKYLDVFDSKSTRALRKIVNGLLEDPMASKNKHYLKNRVFDLNQQVRSLAEGRAGKVLEAVSDMAVYAGEKFVESQSHKLIRVPKQGLISIGEWLASKAVDFQAKATRKDWAIAQLYKAQCKMEKCK